MEKQCKKEVKFDFTKKRSVPSGMRLVINVK